MAAAVTTVVVPAGGTAALALARNDPCPVWLDHRYDQPRPYAG